MAFMCLHEVSSLTLQGRKGPFLLTIHSLLRGTSVGLLVVHSLLPIDHQEEEPIAS